MYPLVRFARAALVDARRPPLPITGVHVSHHVCLPWDLDPWWELNNGRTLTLYDLGRIPLARRTGLLDALRRNRWGLTVAGVAFRYRRRIRVFDRFELRSRLIGWDRRFLYVEQAMFRPGACTSHGIYRTAVTSAEGIVDPSRAAAALGHDGPSPDLPAWVLAWIAAEDSRPWPPGI